MHEWYEWIITLVAALAAVGALWFTANSFVRLRKTEQVRLSKSILRDVRNFVKEYTVLSSEKVSNTDDASIRQRKLNHFLDQVCEALEWHCLLIEIREINDQRLLDHFERAIIKWHNDLLVKYVGVELISSGETKYPYFRKV
jgi:hypothetical protein